MGSDNFIFPSPAQIDARFFEEGGRERVEQILNELANSMAKSQGTPGARGRFDFMSDDSELIRETVLMVVRRQWEATVNEKDAGGGYTLVVKGPRRAADQ